MTGGGYHYLLVATLSAACCPKLASIEATAAPVAIELPVAKVTTDAVVMACALVVDADSHSSASTRLVIEVTNESSDAIYIPMYPYITMRKTAGGLTYVRYGPQYSNELHPFPVTLARLGPGYTSSLVIEAPPGPVSCEAVWWTNQTIDAWVQDGMPFVTRVGSDLELDVLLSAGRVMSQLHTATSESFQVQATPLPGL